MLHSLKEETKCQEEMEQDREVRDQKQAAAAELEWAVNEAEWVVKAVLLARRYSYLAGNSDG